MVAILLNGKFNKISELQCFAKDIIVKVLAFELFRSFHGYVRNKQN